MKKCQLLANLCVLQLYNEDATVCRLYKDAVSKLNGSVQPYYEDAGFKNGPMPWLFYESTNARSVIEKPEKVKFRTSFDY